MSNKIYAVVSSYENDPYSDSVLWCATLEEALERRANYEYDGPTFEIVVKLPITKEMIEKYKPDYLRD